MGEGHPVEWTVELWVGGNWRVVQKSSDDAMVQDLCLSFRKSSMRYRVTAHPIRKSQEVTE